MSAYSRSYWSLFHSSKATSHDSTSKPVKNMPRSIPSGPCNFRDLTLGAHASNCGCQRFWAVESAHAPPLPQPQPTLANPSTANTWCFCGHHACFHKSDPVAPAASDGMEDEVQEPPHIPRLASKSAGPVRVQWSSSHQRSFAGRNSPRPDTPAARHVSQAAQAPSRVSTASVQARSRLPSALGLYADDGPARLQQGFRNISSPLMPSTRRNSLTDRGERDALFQQPIAKHPLSHAALEQAQALCPSLEIPAYGSQLQNPDDNAQSATEVATPSVSGTPALRGVDDVMQSIKAGVNDLRKDLSSFQPLQHHIHPEGLLRPNNTPQGIAKANNGSNGHTAVPLDATVNSLGISKLIAEIATLRQALAQTPSVAASIHGLSCRVDALENFSFSHVAPVEDLGERLDHFDGRLIDMENKVDDLEKLRAEYDQILGSPPTRSFAEDANRDGSSVDQSRGNAIQRLQTLEEKLYDLESLQGPSADQPLEVEVVLLPWGHDLQGVWVQPDSAGNISETPHSSESTLHKDTAGSADGSTLPVGLDEWRSVSTGAWRVPRACGPQSGAGGRTYERLESRGFVRTVRLTDRTPRHVHLAICSAFGELLPTADSHNIDSAAEHLPLAFKSPFIPLRKVHKSSRLRFLSEAELATPMLWTSAFLSSSVFMKAPSARLTRLYMTTPSAYMQQGEPSWTWQKLRELPRLDVKESAGSIQGVGVDEADAMEPCWQWDSRLDPPASTHTSFTSNDSFQKQLSGDSFASSHPLSPKPTELEADVDVAEEVEIAEEASEEIFSSQSSDGSLSEVDHPAPITPITDIPPSSSRQSLLGRRTASLPASDRASASHVEPVGREASQPKRAAISFDAAIGMQLLSDPAEAQGGLTVQKRRRLSREPEVLMTRSLSRTSRDGQSSVIHQQRELVSGKSPRDPAQHAYATPYSWSHGAAGVARANWEGTEPDTDADGDLNMSDQDDSDYEEDSDVDDEFADDQDDMDDELDHALTRDEEEWAGVGDAPMSEDDSSDDNNDDSNDL